ncbi:unnamed protein product [Ceratitis capitata]|uniref:(Mediterranean fruit fly) hypothetical protein n=1 Tax=Ceratitis capitata TaxID=7213 RepID=A0A811V4E8_CERCA|nr:unnamed protein product [Ceratitis capitata]
MFVYLYYKQTHKIARRKALNLFRLNYSRKRSNVKLEKLQSQPSSAAAAATNINQTTWAIDQLPKQSTPEQKQKMQQ